MKKKIIAGIIGLSLFASFGAVAFATTDCTANPTDPSCFVGNGDPSQATNAWGLDGYHTPSVVAGAVIQDGFGNADLCPAFLKNVANPGAACMDISHTAYYIGLMTAAGFSPVR